MDMTEGAGSQGVPHPSPADRGMVTAELAVGLLSLVWVLGTALGLVAAATTKVQLIDAARQAARMYARGDDLTDVRRSGARHGVRLEVVQDESEVEVTAYRDVGGVALLPEWELSATVVTAVESGGP